MAWVAGVGGTGAQGVDAGQDSRAELRLHLGKHGERVNETLFDAT